MRSRVTMQEGQGRILAAACTRQLVFVGLVLAFSGLAACPTSPLWAETRTIAKDAPAASQSPSSFRRFYSDRSFWNLPIAPDAAIDERSGEILSRSIVRYARGANFANSDQWGVALVYADAASRRYEIACTRYGCENTIRFRIPAGAQPATGSDRHLVVIDGEMELDMWLAGYDAAADRWSAGSRYVNQLHGWGAGCQPGQQCGGAVAAGFSAMGGVVRPEEIRQGRIDHALALATPYTRKDYVACPAVNTDGQHSDAEALPEGARVQLDPTFNVDAQLWAAWKKTIARALQVYGAYVVDTSGSLAIRGQTDHNRGNLSWASVGVPKSALLVDLPWDRMRVLKLQRCLP